ncbi:MAG: beta-N-acetylhexosaminidase [Thiohalocapsa sp.]
MNPRHQAGGLFILGFDGTRVDAGIVAIVEQWRPAGFILFRRNIESPRQVAELCRGLRGLYPEADPPLISVDQEGGRVARLRSPFTELPSARNLGRHFLRTGSLEFVERAAALSAAELTAVGINLNYAPVMDVDSNPDNPVIGDRAFAADPETVALIGSCQIQTFQQHGLLACAKHFPGHGDTSTDSHHDLPVVERNRVSLEQMELLPFRHAVASGVAAVMTAHVLYPALDATYPATLSRPILTELLREEMGFDGLIVTDNMEMKGVSGRWPAEELVGRSIDAGCDLFIGGGGGLHGQQPQTYIQFSLLEALAQQIETGRILNDRIDASLDRLRMAKRRWIGPSPDLSEADLASVIGSAEHQRVAKALGSDQPAGT